MKRIYSTMMMLASMIAALSFSACGGNDDDEMSNGNGNNAIKGKHLAKYTKVSDIYSTYSYANKHDSLICYYTYDKLGRITNIEKNEYDSNKQNTHISTTITYHDNGIIRKENGNILYEFTLSDNIITKISSKSRTDGYDINLYYNDGYCIEMIYDFTADDKVDFTLRNIWRDGNLVQQEQYRTPKLDILFLYDREYTNYIDYNGIISKVIEGTEETIGYMGKESKNLLRKISVDGVVHTTYEWTVKNDFPIKLVLKYSTRKYDYGRIVETENVDTYYFEWE